MFFAADDLGVSATPVVDERLTRRVDRADATRLNPVVGRPARHVVEDDCLLAVRSVVELAARETRGLEFKGTKKLVVIDRLMFNEAPWSLHEEYAARVDAQRLEHDTPDCLVASVSEGNCSRNIDRTGHAVDGFIVAPVRQDTHLRVRGAVGAHHEHTRWAFGKGSVESVQQPVRVVHGDMSSSGRIVVDGHDASVPACDF